MLVSLISNVAPFLPVYLEPDATPARRQRVRAARPAAPLAPSHGIVAVASALAERARGRRAARVCRRVATRRDARRAEAVAARQRSRVQQDIEAHWALQMRRNAAAALA